MNKYLAPSNKPRTRSKATNNLLTLSQYRRRSDPQDAGSNRAKEDINVASLQTAGQHANETVALEIVEGLGKAVLLIASAVSVVVLGVVLATMSSLP
jgi:hypothetical protein